MFRNHFKLILRTLWKYKSYTAIHIVGLAIGLTVCLAIYLFIQHELSFDAYHAKAERIYRINTVSENAEGQTFSSVTPYPFAETFRVDFPDLEKIAQAHLYSESIVSVEAGSELFKVNDYLFADEQLVDIFDFQTIEGDLQKTLAQPNQVVLSESLAKRLFGNRPAMGQSINIDGEIDVQVGAIMADVPANTHLQAAMLVSWESLTRAFTGGFEIDNWGITLSGVTYALLPEGYTPGQLEERLMAFAQKYMNEEDNAYENALVLQPLADIHFEPKYNSDSPVTPIRPLYLWIFAIIGGFVLLIACINFINLSTAQAIKRAKEVGVRKVLGAEKRQLIGQFMGEALLITSVAGLIALTITQITLPNINSLLDKHINTAFMQKPEVWLFLATVIVMVTVLSGLYPAFVIARYQPVRVLKSQRTAGNKSSLLLRRSLVVTQFTITLVLIIGTIVMARQLDFMKNKDLGFNKESVILLDMPERDHFETLRTEWLRHPNVQNVSFSVGAPTSRNNIHTEYLPVGAPPDAGKRVSLKTVDSHYAETYGLRLVAGRFLNEQDDRNAVADVPADDLQFSFVVNEKLTQQLGYANPEEILGERLEISISLGENPIQAEVVGVVQDFNLSSLHEEIEPVLMLNLPFLYYVAGLKIDMTDLDNTLAHIEDSWKAQFPDALFEHRFLDETIARQYESEGRLFGLFQTFSGLAILIGCLGLWGLVSFITEQRMKEIGVRKILGATTQNIVLMLSSEFTKLVLVSFVLAVPLGYWIMSKWLDNFSYAVGIGLGVFAIALVIALLLTWLTVSFKSVKAALSNPVKALRTE